MTLPWILLLIVSETPTGGLSPWIESSLVTIWKWSLRSVAESLTQEPAWSWAITKISTTSKELNVISSTKTLKQIATILFQEKSTLTTAQMKTWAKCRLWKFRLIAMFTSLDQNSISFNRRWKANIFARAPWLEHRKPSGFSAALSWMTTIKSTTWRETRSDLFQASTPNQFKSSLRTSMSTLPVSSSFMWCSTAWS